MGTMRLATRGSPLALHQTEVVAGLLRQAHPGLAVEPVIVRTQGDRDVETPLDLIGGQGVFVTEVEAAVRDGRAEAAVHSAKDMPSLHAARPRPRCGAAPGRRPRRPRRLDAGRPGARGAGGDRVGPAPGPAGLAAPGSGLHPAAGEHGAPGGHRRIGRSRRRGGGGGGHGATRLARTAGRCAQSRSTCCPRPARVRWRSSAGPTTRRRVASSLRSTTSRVTGPCAPSAPCWPGWGELHRARRCLPTRGRRRARRDRVGGQRRRADRDPPRPARTANPKWSGPRWRGPCSTAAQRPSRVSTPGRSGRARDGLPGRGRTGRPRAADPARRPGTAPGRRGAPRSPGQPGGAGPGAALGRADRRGQNARRGPVTCRPRSDDCWWNTAAAPTTWCVSRAVTPSSSGGGARRSRCSTRPGSSGRSCPASPRPSQCRPRSGSPSPTAVWPPQ